MKLSYSVLILSCLLYQAPAFCQQALEKTAPLFFEKVYLHTDREIYGQGEDIWFKAYVVNAQDNHSINYSHNLYVELINPVAKVMSREMIRLENGLGNGDFKLSDTIASGHYRLRAYTNWMRNFGDNFIFEKNISILQTADLPFDATAVPAKNKKTAITTTSVSLIAPSAALPVVRFFPEGGDLVNGISSIIGVKAEDEADNGMPASGKIVDNDGKTLTDFTCDSLGFGSFVMVPVEGQHYQAMVMIHGQEQRFILPDVHSDGFSLQVHYLGQDTVKVVINAASSSVSGSHLYLVARHGGKSYVRQAVVLNARRMVVVVPYPLLPEGITEMTLYDEKNQPQCERLIYIHHKDEVKLSLSTEQTVYAPKGEVKVRLKLNSKEKAHLSLAAVTSDIPVPAENILSYLNLQSEIKGTIEIPNRYFDTTNTNRLKQLDLLLLTQGWRGFVWKKLADTSLHITYQPEQGISLTGRVRRVGANKPLAGIDVTMRAPMADGQKLFWATTDSSGRFAITNTKFYGYQYLNFTSRKSDKINNDGESKGNSGGYIQVDSLLRDTLPVRPVAVAFAKDTSWIARQQADAEIERIRQSLKLKADRNLKEVTIKAHTSRVVTRLPPEIHPITLVEQKEYDNLTQYLLYMIEGSSVISDSCHWCTLDPGILSIYMMQGPNKVPVTGVYSDHSSIDYCRLCQEQYLNLPMSNILKVTINRIEDVYGKHTSVSIIMRPGVLDTKDYFDNTMADVVGYYKARVFYKPDIAKPNNVDLRTNTIHWEPNITTDDNGEASFTFYNTDKTGNVSLVAEGVTNTGTPLSATADYEVK